MTVSSTGRLSISFSKKVLTPLSISKARRILDADSELSLGDFLDIYIKDGLLADVDKSIANITLVSLEETSLSA